MELALSYLQKLFESGYFERIHTYAEGVWFEEHPACKDAKTWEGVIKHLLEGGYLQRSVTSIEELKSRGVHPKDWLDAWWFVLTDKGRNALKMP